MAQIDDILSVLRHRIIEPFESGPPKPATQEMVSPVKHSAVVAMLRLAHPGRDDGAVVGDDYPSRSTLREVAGGSRRCARRRCGGPSCWKRRSAEMNGDGGAAPRPTESAAPAALVPATPTPQDGDADKTAITLLFDTRVLARIDADGKRVGIGRTAWLHVAADERLEGR
jgi:hypothetical protein